MQEVGPEGASAPQEALNEKAVKVIRRVQDKLAGLDFGNKEPYDVNKQVELLIQEVRACWVLCCVVLGGIVQRAECVLLLACICGVLFRCWQT